MKKKNKTWLKNRIKEGYKLVNCPFCKAQYFYKNIVRVVYCSQCKMWIGGGKT